MNDPFTLGQEINNQRLALNIVRDQVITLTRKVGKLMDTRGYSLWCTPGDHAFSDADKGRKPMSTIDDDGDDYTVWMCSQHLPDFMKKEEKPKRKLSLAAIEKLINEADVVDE